MPDFELLNGISDAPEQQFNNQPFHDLYQMFNVGRPVIQDKPASSIMSSIMNGNDPLKRDIDPIQTNLETIKPYQTTDGIDNYGYSNFLNNGDNEDRYAQDFRKDNPNKFYSGVNPFKLAYRGIYWGGAFAEKTLESAAVKTGQGLASIYGLTVGNIGNAAQGKIGSFGDWISESTDNVLSKTFDGWDNWLKSRYNYYQEASDRNNKGFIASLGDGDFWMNDISDGLGFLVSSSLEVGLISKLGLGTKLASRLAPLAEAVPGAEEIAEGASGFSKFRQGLEKVGNFAGIEGSGNAFVKNAVDLTSETLVTTAAEAASEAREAKEKIYSSLSGGQINPKTGLTYSEDEKKRLSAEGAAQVFRQNMAILIGPKFLETLVFHKIGAALKSKFSGAAAEAEAEAGKASEAVESKGLSAGVEYKKPSFYKQVWKVGSAAPIGFLSEGLWEENVQLAISRTAENSYGATDYTRPSTDEKTIEKERTGMFSPFGGEVGSKYLQQIHQFVQGSKDDRALDDELSKSVGIGGLFGVGGGIIHGALSIRKQAKVDNYWTNRINAATANLFQSDAFYKTETKEVADPQNPGKTKTQETPIIDPKTGQPVVDTDKVKAYLGKMNSIQGVMDIIANTEDANDPNSRTQQAKEMNKLVRNSLFAKLAMEYVQAGKEELLTHNLKSIANFSDKDIQALGYEPGMLKGHEKQELVERMTKMTERLKNVNDWVDNNVLDNVSEKRQGLGGLMYTKTQKEQRAENFEKKKAYLKGLGMQNSLLDMYEDEVKQSNLKLGETKIDDVFDENGVPLNEFVDNYNSKIPALKNHLDVLHQQLAHHWDNLVTAERTAPKAKNFSAFSKSQAGNNISYHQVMVDETLEKINSLQEEHDKLSEERKNFLENNEDYKLEEQDGNQYVFKKDEAATKLKQSLQDIADDKQRRINAVKLEEIGIQRGWNNEEFQNVAALKEEKSKAGRDDTYLSRRMILSKNAYNTFFEREVKDRDNALGQRKMNLYHKDEAKRINDKKYVANEDKLMKAVRIQGKVTKIVAENNGQKLVAEMTALLEKNLPSKEFTEALKALTDNYNGKPLVLDKQAKTLVDDQLDATQDEKNYVQDMMMGGTPDDDRFNDKYQEINELAEWQPKQEFDDMHSQAAKVKELNDRIDDLNKIKNYLDSIPEEIPGDWNNPVRVKKRIADVYTETADNIINTYNQLSNQGQSEVSGDSFSSKQELDSIDHELDELGQLKTIFNDRDKKDKILANGEFKNFIEDIDKRIADLKKIRDIVKERLASRLRENHNFLVDAVNNHTEQLGLNFDGTTKNQSLEDMVKGIVGEAAWNTLKTTLTDLKTLMDKEDKSKEDKDAIEKAYWSVNGQVAAIQELVKSKDRQKVLDKIAEQKKESIKKLFETKLMQKIKDQKYYKEIEKVVDSSLLGALQVLFYQSEFSQVGMAGGGDTNFLDDQPASSVYKFREDYNLRKFLRNVERDNSRTADNTDISKEDLTEFLKAALDIQQSEDIQKSLSSKNNLLDQVEKEKEAVQAKMDAKDNKYENLIVSSIQQIFFIRNIANFIKRETGTDGFKNWTYIQAPGGSGKTQTLGTWFNAISGIARDRMLVTAFTEEAAKGIKKALLAGGEGPKNAEEMVDHINKLTSDKNFDQDVLIIDEFPAIDVQTQKALYDAVSAYSKAKQEAGKGEFKVITMGDTNQLTFNQNGSVSPRPTIIVNPTYFGKDAHPAEMNIIPSLTVNFRSNIFAVTSFIDQFKGSNKDSVNESLKVSSSDPSLESKDAKGVVSVDKSSFKTKIINYIKNNIESPRTRTLIVNESKIDTYRKLLEDSGIKIITDPNDTITKGVYLTTVKNVQGFSFDEVYIDLENNDKTMFSGTSSLNYIYNKAMYVAASRARDLVVVTNFPHFENVQDQSIEQLQSKAMDDLRTKDDQFVNDRNTEIEGAKKILGDQYSVRTNPSTTVKAEEKVETSLDPEVVEKENKGDEAKPGEAPAGSEEEKEAETTEDEKDVETEEKIPFTAAPSARPVEENPEKPSGTDDPYASPKIIQEEPEDNSEDQPSGPAVEPTTGEEDQKAEEEVTDPKNKTLGQATKEMMEAVKDKAIKAFDKLANGITELLFPTGQSLKFKIGDNDFSINPRRLENYEHKNIASGDKIILIPFQQANNTKSQRKFGYAVVSQAVNQEGKEVPNTYRTVAVLSDNEIDRMRSSNPDVSRAIDQQEQQDRGFVSILYGDISDKNGFVVSGDRAIDPIMSGQVVYANPIKYFYDNNYRRMDQGATDGMIDTFINSFYKNQLDAVDPAERPDLMRRLRNFYNNHENAQIVIPTNADVIDTPRRRARFRVPPELKGYVRPGRPYMMFKNFYTRGDWQFVGLSRRFLNGRDHADILNPIREFTTLGRQVKADLEAKGVDSKIGFSRSMSNFLSRAAAEYQRDRGQDTYTIPFTRTNRNTRETTSRDIQFSNAELERLYNFYSMYSTPSQGFKEASSVEDIQKLVSTDERPKRARRYIFDDGSTILGTIRSIDPNTRTFVVRDRDTGEELTKGGVIRYADRAVTGPAQQAMDNIMTSNGHIAKNFTSGGGRIGFVTEKSSANNVSENRNYKFMAMLGSKASPVVKEWNSDGTVRRFYEDVFDILDDLFNFDERGELPAKRLQYQDGEGNIQGQDVKFRVPVPSVQVNQENGETEHNYDYGANNLSRDRSEPNSRYFESNFNGMLPSRVFVKFGEEAAPVAEAQVQEGVTPQEQAAEEEQAQPQAALATLTREEIRNLSIDELQARLTPQQRDMLDAYARENGWDNIDHFFSDFRDASPMDQESFRDYMIDCLLGL